MPNFQFRIPLNRSIFISVCFALFSFHSSSQVVNIEAQRIVTDTTGWFGDVNGDFSFQQNVSTIYSFNAGVHAEYKSKNNKDLWLFLGTAGLLKVDSSNFANNALALALYNRKLGKLLRAEAYSVIFDNHVTNIRVRWVAGAGPRFKFLDKKILKIYAGIPVQLEYEESLVSDVATTTQARFSPYLTFTFLPVANLKLVSTTYYQPRADDFNDYRILHVDQLKIDVTKKFAFSIDFSYLYDQFPQPNVPNKILALSTGLKYKFR